MYLYTYLYVYYRYYDLLLVPSLISSRHIAFLILKLNCRYSYHKTFSSSNDDFFAFPQISNDILHLGAFVKSFFFLKQTCLHCVLGKCIFILHDPKTVSHFLKTLFFPFLFPQGNLIITHFCCHCTLYFPPLKYFTMSCSYLLACLSITDWEYPENYFTYTCVIKFLQGFS